MRWPGSISLVEDAHPALREVMALIAPDAGRAHVVGVTGAPGRRQVDDDQRARHGLPGRAASASACSPSTRRRRSPAVRCSVTGSGCPTTPPTPRSSSARWPRAATSAGCRGRRRRPCACSTPPAATSCCSRPWASGSPRSRSPATADTTLVLLAPGMGDGIQAAKAGILEVADVLVVNKADREGADRTVRDLRHAVSLGDRRRPGRLAGAGGAHRRAPTAAGSTSCVAARRGPPRVARRRRAARAPGAPGRPRDRGAGAGGAAGPGRRACAATPGCERWPTRSWPGAPTRTPPPTSLVALRSPRGRAARARWRDDADVPDLATKPTIHGRLVTLRPFRDGDAEVMAQVLSDPEVRRLTGSVESTAEAERPSRSTTGCATGTPPATTRPTGSTSPSRTPRAAPSSARSCSTRSTSRR